MIAAQAPAHTPGPWQIDETRRAIPVVAGLKTLALVLHQSLPEAENLADARLIAAAPDLLAVLKIAAELIDGSAHCEDPSAFIDLCRDTIAKAEGRAP